MRPTLIVGFAALLPLAVGVGAERAAPRAGQSTRSEALAVNGMVCASHPLAAQVGLDVLKGGGNAVDAAIATNAALGLMEPTSCGVGGDLFAIVFDAKSQKLYGLNASGPAPKRATIELFKSKGLASIPERGPLSWSVPGCVGGWDALQSRFGTRKLGDLLAPGIRYAESGVPVPEVIAGYWKASEKLLAADPGLAETFLVGGRAPVAGQVFKNPRLAETYRRIADAGRDGFYEGDTAGKIVAFSEAVGGLLSASDLAEFTPEWIDPVSTTYRNHEVHELPPPGQGVAALQMLNLLEPHDLKSMGPESADYWHLLIEAKKLAFADRARYYADPRFARVPTPTLISKDYAASRGKLLDLRRAAVDPPAGDGLLGKADTVYLTVVDQDRNCVSLIQSNYTGFGSYRGAPGTGFGLQNRGCLFSLDPAHANKLEPGKRPFHTIIPAMLTQGGLPKFSFGVMGGDMQPQGHTQVVVNLLDFGMGVQACGDAPRLEHVGSATPTGKPELTPGGTVLAEPGIPEAVVSELVKRGHAVRRVKVNSGGYQGILIDRSGGGLGVLRGGSESRKDGCALGY